MFLAADHGGRVAVDVENEFDQGIDAVVDVEERFIEGLAGADGGGKEGAEVFGDLAEFYGLDLAFERLGEGFDCVGGILSVPGEDVDLVAEIGAGELFEVVDALAGRGDHGVHVVDRFVELRRIDAFVDGVQRGVGTVAEALVVDAFELGEDGGHAAAEVADERGKARDVRVLEIQVLHIERRRRGVLLKLEFDVLASGDAFELHAAAEAVLHGVFDVFVELLDRDRGRSVPGLLDLELGDVDLHVDADDIVVGVDHDLADAADGHALIFDGGADRKTLHGFRNKRGDVRLFLEPVQSAKDEEPGEKDDGCEDDEQSEFEFAVVVHDAGFLPENDMKTAGSSGMVRLRIVAFVCAAAREERADVFVGAVVAEICRRAVVDDAFFLRGKHDHAVGDTEDARELVRKNCCSK